MAAALPLKRPVKVGELVRRRLRELKRTPRELAPGDVPFSEQHRKAVHHRSRGMARHVRTMAAGTRRDKARAYIGPELRIRT